MKLGRPRRIWAIPSIHANLSALSGIHDLIFSEIEPGDRIVYLGNYTGYSAQSVETIDELLMFRRAVMARPGMLARDLVYLRGVQEEIWQKLFQLQFAPNPEEVLQWMLHNGVAETLEDYGILPEEGLCAAHNGVMSLTRWTNFVKDKVNNHPGHAQFRGIFRRAAFTDFEEPDTQTPLLFVHAGIDPEKTLENQGDGFWWGGHDFDRLSRPYDPFAKVVRGYDPQSKGIRLNCVTATLDNGSGFGGSLVCAGFTSGGEVFDTIEA